MKINWTKLLRVVGRLMLAAPVIVEAVRPVVAGGKPGRAAPTSSSDERAPRAGQRPSP